MSELTIIFFLVHAEAQFTAGFYTFCCHCFQCYNLEGTSITGPVQLSNLKNMTKQTIVDVSEIRMQYS